MAPACISTEAGTTARPSSDLPAKIVLASAVASICTAMWGMRRFHGSIRSAKDRKTSGGATTIATSKIGSTDIGSRRAIRTQQSKTSRWRRQGSPKRDPKGDRRRSKTDDRPQEDPEPTPDPQQQEQRSFCQQNPVICVAVPIIISIPIIIGAPELVPLIPIFVP